MKRFLRGLLLSLVPIFAQQQAAAETVAIIGDSISTGGASHDALAFDFGRLSKVFTDKTSVAPDQATMEFLTQEIGVPLGEGRPQRINLASREYTHPLSWVANRFVTSLFSRYLDTEEYSWGYLLSLTEQIDVQTLAIAARDGERSLHARQQMDRILDHNGGKAPFHTFIFFTGNDLCSPDASLITPGDEYGAHIQQAVRYLLNNGKVEGERAHIWLVDPIGILQLVSSPSIQQKKVPAFGKEMSCADLQAGRNLRDPLQPEPLPQDASAMDANLKRVFDFMLGQGPRQMCPSLFAVHDKGASEGQFRLGNTLKAYREELDKVAKNLSQAHPQFRIHRLRASSGIVFEGQDIANDCFHLGPRGQLKVAKSLREEVHMILPEGLKR